MDQRVVVKHNFPGVQCDRGAGERSGGVAQRPNNEWLADIRVVRLYLFKF